MRRELAVLDSRISFDGADAYSRGIDGAMIRFGQGGDISKPDDVVCPYIDKGFLGHRSECILNKIPYGVLYQCVALSLETAEAEADWLLSQLAPIHGEIQLYVALQFEDIPYHPRYSSLGRLPLNGEIAQYFCERLMREGYRPIIAVTPESQKKILGKRLFKAVDMWFQCPNVAERVMRKNCLVKPLLWTYGASFLYQGLGVCGDITILRRGDIYHIPMNTGDFVTVYPGTKVYARKSDPMPCAVLRSKMTRVLWDGTPSSNKRYAVCLLKQMCGKPACITYWLSAADAETGAMRARFGEIV